MQYLFFGIDVHQSIIEAKIFKNYKINDLRFKPVSRLTKDVTNLRCYLYGITTPTFYCGNLILIQCNVYLRFCVLVKKSRQGLDNTS